MTRTSRTRRFVAGTAAAAALASGVAFAFFLDSQTYTGNTAVGGEITLTSSLDDENGELTFDGVDGRGLYPTANTAPGTGDVESFSISNGNDVSVSYQLTAANTESGDEAQQFSELFVRLTDEGGDTTFYEGLLADLSLDSAIVLPAQSGERFFNVELFLLETGDEQAQLVTTTFSLTLDAQTTPSERAEELDGGPADGGSDNGGGGFPSFPIG